MLKVAAKDACHESGNGGTRGATEVAGERKQGKHRRAAEFDAFRRKREGAGPENADGKAAKNASDQSDHGVQA